MEVRKDETTVDACDSDPKGGFAVTVRADYRYRPSTEEAAAIETERKALRKQRQNLDELPPEIKAERQVGLDKTSAANKAENAARLKAMNDQLSIVGVEISANELFPFAPQAGFGSEIRAGTVPAPRTGGLKIHGVRMVVEGPASRRKTIEALADKKKLASLVE